MQTEVLDNPLLGSAGDIADLWTAEHGDIASRKSEETTIGILPGVMVAEGTTEETALRLAANNDVLGGICVRGHFGPPLIDVTVNSAILGQGFAPGSTFGVGRTGRYLVIISANVAKGDEVHVRAVAAGTELAGSFRPTKDGADTIDCTGFCTWFKGGEVDADTGFGVAVLDVNMGLAQLATADS